MNDEHYDTPEFVRTAEREDVGQMEQTASMKVEENPIGQWLGSGEIDELQSHWNSIQSEFVDDPHASVEKAKALVAETMDKIIRKLSDRQSTLNESIAGKGDISTEDLRVALQQFRMFFHRLVDL